MRLVIDSDLAENYIRITTYSHSEVDLVAVALEIQGVLMNLAAQNHYKRRDYELIGCEDQDPAIERWGWIASSNSPRREIPRRDEIAEIEIRTTTPPEELPLPSKCLKCIMEDNDDSDDAPGFATHSDDPRLKVPG